VVVWFGSVKFSLVHAWFALFNAGQVLVHVGSVELSLVHADFVEISFVHVGSRLVMLANAHFMLVH
jgi:hypothetical protein